APKGGTGRNIAAWIAVDRVVQHVKRFGAETQVHALRDGGLLLERSVQFPITGSTSQETSRIAPRAFSGHFEGRGIKPLEDGFVGGIDGDTRHEVGPLVGAVTI